MKSFLYDFLHSDTIPVKVFCNAQINDHFLNSSKMVIKDYFTPEYQVCNLIFV